MANIKVQDLLAINPVGAELFSDPESFMKELSEDSEQMEGIYGGCKVSVVCDYTCGHTVAALQIAE